MIIMIIMIITILIMIMSTCYNVIIYECSGLVLGPAGARRLHAAPLLAAAAAFLAAAAA